MLVLGVPLNTAALVRLGYEIHFCIVGENFAGVKRLKTERVSAKQVDIFSDSTYNAG